MSCARNRWPPMPTKRRSWPTSQCAPVACWLKPCTTAITRWPIGCAISCGAKRSALEQLTAYACVPIFRGSDIRYQYELGGGALMDLGCYAIDLLRLMAGSEPEVISAEALLAGPAVDRAMRAELPFCQRRIGAYGLFDVVEEFSAGRSAGPRPARLAQSYESLRPAFIAFSALERRRPQASRKNPPWRNDLLLPIATFVEAVRNGSPLETDAANAVATLRVIDSIYRRAGLPPRGLAPEVVGLQR